METIGNPPKETADFKMEIINPIFSTSNSQNKGGIFDQTDSDATILANIDSAGKWHNEFLDILYAKISSTNSFTCTTSFNDSVDAWSAAYFSSHNIQTTGSLLRYAKLLESDFERPANDTRVSLAADSYFDNLDNITGGFRFDSSVQYEQKFDSLALAVQSDLSATLTSKERIMILGSISLSKNSAMYWANNRYKWFNYFNGTCGRPASCVTCKISPTEKAVLQSDSKGAIAGGMASIGGGPLVFAGALVGGGMASCIKAIRIGTHSDGWLDWLF